MPPSNTGSALQQDKISHLSHQQWKDTTSQRNHFIWTAGGLSTGEEYSTLFDNSCNYQKIWYYITNKSIASVPIVELLCKLLDRFCNETTEVAINNPRVIN